VHVVYASTEYDRDAGRGLEGLKGQTEDFAEGSLTCDRALSIKGRCPSCIAEDARI
jgi:hypothetical protein